ncbi:carbohydrate kinase, FGGY, partial [Kipferlia bialata]
FIVFTANSDTVAVSQIAHEQIHPEQGWTEHDPREIMLRVQQTMEDCARQLHAKGIPVSSVKAIGVTNQRETCLVWDTHNHICNAVVWHDTRTADLVESLVSDHGGQGEEAKGKDCFRHITGLPLSTYFSGAKLMWLRQNHERVGAAFDLCDKYQQGHIADAPDTMVGTIDSWIIHQLTGVHVTDVSNASRTMLMDISSCEWSPAMCEVFSVPMCTLPKIVPSSGTVAKLRSGPFMGIPISGIAGDQQSALFGHRCFEKGMAKCTFGTGAFLLSNTGTVPVFSDKGLLTTVAYQLPGEKPVYALEGSVAAAGCVVEWLVSMGIIDAPEQLGPLAGSVPDSGGLTVVPALTGMLAPHWRPDARGCFLGMSLATTKAHVCKATLEGIAMSVSDVLGAASGAVEVLTPVAGEPTTQLLAVDGGLVRCHEFVQIQSDLANVRIAVPSNPELTAIGAASLAAMGVGHKDGVHPTSPPEIVCPKDGLPGDEYRHAMHLKWMSLIDRAFDLA